MSAPSRGRGAGQGTPPAPRGRGGNRGAFSNTSRGRGRGRGSASASSPGNTNGGLLQKLRTGTLQRDSEDGAQPSTRGRGTSARVQTGSTRGRGGSAKSFGTTKTTALAPISTPQSLSSGPVPSSYRDFMAQMGDKYNLLKPKRDVERKKAIGDGFLADPDKKTSLANAITPVGTCTEMCPEFERVERIVQNMVDKAEKIPNDATGRDVPSEERMIKRFRRSAAGYDEQLPSDIRTPETLRRTLNYLLDNVIGGDYRLASIHKFVWDRTRGIRNDFSIQQVSKPEDVKIAVECYERIARFHILSLHQLSNSDNLQEDEHFEPQQEREQLNNTFLSLMYYYDDYRGVIPFPNEAEFRAYCILFELQSLHPDLEERMQSWPRELLDDPKIQTAFRLYAAAGNTVFDQGPLRPLAPFSIAQSNPGRFWTVLTSREVSYLMACVAEMNFSQIRFTALDALWRSGKSAPQGQQARSQDWTMGELTSYLAFDNDEQTLKFVQEFGLAFGTADSGEEYLDFTALSSNTLDKSAIPIQQVFSHDVVEEKRYRRTLVAIINGINVATAIRQGMVIEASQDEDEEMHTETKDDGQSLFIPENSSQQSSQLPLFGSKLNAAAPTFAPFSANSFSTNSTSLFGKNSGGGTNEAPSVRDPTPASASAPVFGSPSAFTPLTQSNNTKPVSTSLSEAPKNVGFGFGLFQPSAPAKLTQASQFPADPAQFDSNPIYPKFNLGGSSPGTSSQAQSEIKNTSTPTSSDFTFGKPTSFTPLHSIQNVSKSNEQAAPPAVGTFFGKGFPKQQERVKESQDKPVVQTSSAAPPVPVFNFTPATSTTQTQQASPGLQQLPGFIPGKEKLQQPGPQSPPVSESKQPFFTPSAQSSAGSSTPSLFAPKEANTTPFFSTPQQPAKGTQVFTTPSQAIRENSRPVSGLQFSVASGAPSLLTPQPALQTTQPSGFKFPSLDQTQAAIGKASVPTPTPELIERRSDQSSVLSQSLQLPQPTQISQAVQQPEDSVFTEIDRGNLVQQTAKLLLVQSEGLFEYFIGNHVSSILQRVVKEYQQDQRDHLLNALRIRVLSRKFFTTWRETVQENILNRRANKRRKLLATAMQAEYLKKRRSEQELEAIIIATQETKRIQEHQRRIKEETEKKRVEETKRLQESEAQSGRSAGAKRKSLAESDNNRPVSSTLAMNGKSHKRSKTVGAVFEPSQTIRSSSSPRSVSRASAASTRFTQSSLGRSTSSQDLRRSGQSQKVDSTRTEYFKLKAMGIDPDTPLIPDTKASLALKNSRQAEKRTALLSRLRSRHGSMSTASNSPRKTTEMAPPPKPEFSTRASAVQELVTSPQPLPNTDDDFLKQLREARETMSQDAEWFKSQTVELEKEISEQNALRQSQQFQRSEYNHAPSPLVLNNGLANANGYDYVPASSQFGRSLSRTEQRIRQTGAHGLATKPIGGGIGDYTPVAMSKRTASRQNMSSYGGNTMRAESDRKRVRDGSSRRYSGQEGNQNIEQPSAAKRQRNGDGRYGREVKNVPAAHSTNLFTTLNSAAQSEDDDDELSTYHNGIDGDTEDDSGDEDEILEDDEEDDDEEIDEEGQDDTFNFPYKQHPSTYSGSLPDEVPVYDDEDDNGQDSDSDDSAAIHAFGSAVSGFGYPVVSRGSSGTGTGSAIGSRAQSQGVGASADDALVLSD